MAERAEVCVMVPTWNEAETIGDVVDGFRERGFENVLVVDGHSRDGTADVARERGARVLQQSGSGKGQAVREGLEHVRAEYVLLLDGDMTYRPEDADAMLEPLFSGEYDHVIGDRFADMHDEAMTQFNAVGNSLVNRAFAFIHGRNLQDILSGYRAFTTDSVDRMSLSAEGFGIETEMAVECVKHDIPTTVVPVRYEPRPEGSETNLRPVRDGARIFVTLYKLAKTNNPLFYFGSVGFISIFVGFLLGAYVGYEWFVDGVSHEIMAILAGVGVLFGVQLLMFGVLSDLIVTLHREQMRRIEDD